MEELVKHKAALRREITYLTSKLEDHDTGHIRTTINVLEQRIKDIEDFIDGIHRRAFEYLEARDNDKHDETVEAMINKAGSM
jgi:uncharacterized protein Yka (UPF0111/DUF47 family)